MSSVGTPPRALQGGSCIGWGVTTTTGTHLQAVASGRARLPGVNGIGLAATGYDAPGGIGPVVYSARSTRAGLTLAAARAGQ